MRSSQQHEGRERKEMTRKGPIRKVDKERGEQSCQRGLKEGRDENKIEIVKKERRRKSVHIWREGVWDVAKECVCESGKVKWIVKMKK